MAIRPATAEDTAALAALVSELSYPTSPEEMAARLAAIRPRADYTTLVAVAGGEVAGMIGLAVSPSFVRNTPNGQIVAMVVGEKYRRRGIGQALLAQADVWFAARGVQRVSLTSALHRSDAHAFYRACGYRENGLRFVRKL